MQLGINYNILIIIYSPEFNSVMKLPNVSLNRDIIKLIYIAIISMMMTK